MVGFSLGGPVAAYHGLDEAQYDADWGWTEVVGEDSCFPNVTERPDVIVSIAGSFVEIGFPSEIQSLSHAISLLGTMTVRNLVLAASMKETYKRFGLLEKLLWQHSALSGPTAAMLADYRGIAADPEIAFTAGLMHHIGKTALANSHRSEYERVMMTVYNEGRSFTEVENEVFGFSHAELGAAVVQQWGLPDTLVLTIQHHHNPGMLAELDDEVARMCALITVTSLTLSKLGVGRSQPIEDLDLAAQPAWAFLDLGEQDVEPILSACAERVKDSQDMTA